MGHRVTVTAMTLYHERSDITLSPDHPSTVVSTPLSQVAPRSGPLPA